MEKESLNRTIIEYLDVRSSIEKNAEMTPQLQEAGFAVAIQIYQLVITYIIPDYTQNLEACWEKLITKLYKKLQPANVFIRGISERETILNTISYLQMKLQVMPGWLRAST